jgi:hypothetical protein
MQSGCHSKSWPSSPVPVIAQALQLVKIRSHHLASVAVERIYVCNVFNLADRRVQPAAVQTISVEVLADVGEVTLRRFIMTAVRHCPYVMMLDMVQIRLGLFDDTMGAAPVALLRVGWKACREQQSGNSKR